MNFAEQPPSKQWAVLKYRGKRFAEVWFKPEGKPLALTFRIPRESFQNAGTGQLLTAENLVKAVAVAPEEVESWRHGAVSHSNTDGSDAELREPLPPPPEDISHLVIHVSLKPAPVPAAAAEETLAPEARSLRWEDLEARWRSILGVEASIDNLRLSVEGIEGQLETVSKATLTTEEKLHALKPDLAHWNKVKGRVPFALPKVKEFVHRATWATGAPERKKLDDLFKDQVEPDMPYPELVKLADQLENLLKDRQVLSAHGTTVYQECRNLCSEVQAALRTLKSNAAANADKKRRAGRPKGKFFKTVRKWSGVE
jgi:hypothetical protein